MNKKLLAAAVSAAVMAPVAAHAESSFYARVNNAIDINDLSGDGTTDISGVASRFGFKGSADVGNGMTVHGRYEFSTTSDKEGTGVGDTRIATAGLSGGFGRIDVGNQWSAYFDTFGTLISPTYSLGYYLYSSVGGGPYRASNTIKYSNTFGPLYAELDVRLNDSGEDSDAAEKIRGDGIGLGLNFSVTDNITIAAAFDSEDGADIAAIDAFGVGDLSTLNTVLHTRISIETDDIKADLDAQATAAVTASGSAIDAMTLTNDEKTAAKVVPTRDINAQRDIDKNAVDAALDEIFGITEGSAASSEADVDRVGIAIKANFGNFWGSIGHQSIEVDDDKDSTDIDTTFLWVGGSLGEKTSWLVGYAKADNATDAVAAVESVVQTANVSPVAATDAVSAGDDSTQLTWGIYHNLGGGIKLYYEAISLDSGDNDGDRHLLGMRVDF